MVLALALSLSALANTTSWYCQCFTDAQATGPYSSLRYNPNSEFSKLGDVEANAQAFCEQTLGRTPQKPLTRCVKLAQ